MAKVSTYLDPVVEMFLQAIHLEEPIRSARSIDEPILQENIPAQEHMVSSDLSRALPRAHRIFLGHTSL